MKKLLSSACVVVLCVFAGVPSASAQWSAVVKVPFSFVAQGTLLPAGEYRVSLRRNDATVVQLVSTEGRSSVYVGVLPSETTAAVEGASLQFLRVGATCFLSRVALPGGHVREAALPSPGAMQRLAVTAMARANANR